MPKYLLFVLAIVFLSFPILKVYADDTAEDKDRCVEEQCNTQFSKLRKFAMNGSPRAQYILGLMYREGNGTKKDYEKSFKWFKKSSQNRFTPAYFELAVAYKSGIGTKVNSDKYKEYLDKAIDKKSFKAAYHQSRKILKAAFESKITFSQNERLKLRKNSIELLESFDKRTAQGNFLLGIAYEKGVLTEVDNKKAIDYYKLALEYKHPKALDRLQKLEPDFEWNDESRQVAENHVLIEMERPDLASMLQYNVDFIKRQKLYTGVKTGSRIRPCHQTPGCSKYVVDETNDAFFMGANDVVQNSQ